MRTEKVVVTPYQPRWKKDFEQIKQTITEAIGPWIVAIEHVGSTAVEGLSAKPIIDIDAVMANQADFLKIVDVLAQLGYQHEGNLGIEGREAFSYDRRQDWPDHHLYLCSADSKELYRHLTFRDYLRTHPDAVVRYSQVKEEVAAKFPNDIDAYMAYKSSCIGCLYQECGLLP